MWQFGYGKIQSFEESFEGLALQIVATHKERVRKQNNVGIWLWKNTKL